MAQDHVVANAKGHDDMHTTAKAHNKPGPAIQFQSYTLKGRLLPGTNNTVVPGGKTRREEEVERVCDPSGCQEINPICIQRLLQTN